MEKKFVSVALSDVQRDDVVYLDNSENAEPYTVLDVHGEPFVLIEDVRHFGHLYRVVNPLYKLI